MGTLKSLAAVSVTAVTVLALHKPQAHAQTLKANNQSKPNNQNSAKNIKVQPGDSLSAIASKKATTWRRIYNANARVKDPNLIYPGEILRIPATNEKLSNRPLPAGVVPPPPQQMPSQASSSTNSANVVATSAAVPSGSVWDRIAECESGGNWSANTGNGFYGGLQFTISSWRAEGGVGLPSQASPAEQIALAQKLQASQGWGAWPVCSVEAGV